LRRSRKGATYASPAYEARVANEVVARYIDGRTVKGTCLDVDPARPTCHIKTVETGKMVVVKLLDLKALFFVKDFVGDSAHQEAAALDPGDARSRSFSLIELQFKDGERIIGLTARFPPIRPFFFVLPVDIASNNIRILVNRAAVASVRQPSPPAS
jgi:Family of unknown function (DUF6982)